MAAAHCKQDKERIECLEWWVARLLAVDATNFEGNEERCRDLARGLKVGRLFEDLMARERRHRRWLRTRQEPTTTPEDTLREAGVSTKRQARYQRRMSRLLAGRS